MTASQALQNQKYQSCIDACNRCAESCEFCATSCLTEQDVKMLERCIQLNRECASMPCHTASQIMSMDGEHAKQICGVCADIYNTGTQECEKHTQMDHCNQCAQWGQFGVYKAWGQFQHQGRVITAAGFILRVT